MTMTAKASLFAKTPEPPYYAVIFSSQRIGGDFPGPHPCKFMKTSIKLRGVRRVLLAGIQPMIYRGRGLGMVQSADQ